MEQDVCVHNFFCIAFICMEEHFENDGTNGLTKGCISKATQGDSRLVIWLLVGRSIGDPRSCTDYMCVMVMIAQDQNIVVGRVKRGQGGGHLFPTVLHSRTAPVWLLTTDLYPPPSPT